LWRCTVALIFSRCASTSARSGSSATSARSTGSGSHRRTAGISRALTGVGRTGLEPVTSCVSWTLGIVQ
jgi:hypothetical protein